MKPQWWMRGVHGACSEVWLVNEQLTRLLFSVRTRKSAAINLERIG